MSAQKRGGGAHSKTGTLNPLLAPLLIHRTRGPHVPAFLPRGNFSSVFEILRYLRWGVRIYCCYTPAHEVLFREVFLPSVPSGFDVRSTALSIGGPGDYLSAEFLECIRKKIDLVLGSIEENRGDVILWSDVDIRFFQLVPEDLERAVESSGKKILFQRESPRMDDVNTGFFVCRCVTPVLDFFQAVRTELDHFPAENEQMVVNRLLQNEECKMENAEWGRRKGGAKEIEKGNRGGGNPSITWGYLPQSFYARTHGWPPPLHPAIYHANYTKGADAIGQKLAQFREIESLVQGGIWFWLWSVAMRIPKKIFRLLMAKLSSHRYA